MLNKLTVLCFSPTGGTAKAAGFTASALAESAETVDLLHPVTPRTFTAEDTVLIAMPVFGGGFPPMHWSSSGPSRAAMPGQ